MKNKNKILLTVIVASLLGMVCFGFKTSNVFAGTGSSGSAVSSVDGCYQSDINSTTVCTKDGEGGSTGGYAWHIFKTKSNVYTGQKLYKANAMLGPQYCKKKADQDKNTTSCTTPMILDGHEYDHKLATTCPKRSGSSGFDYYVAFVAEGWHGRNKNGYPNSTKKNVNTFWGPSAWNTPLSGKYKQHYNNTNSSRVPLHNKDTVKAAVKNNTNMEGWKINEAAARWLCKNDTTGTCRMSGDDIKKGVGYFCLDTIHDVDLDAVAKDIENNNSLGNGPFDTDTKPEGTDHTVSRKGVENRVSEIKEKGYKFEKWEDNSTGMTLTKKISVDTTVVAWFRRMPSFKGLIQVFDDTGAELTGWDSYKTDDDNGEINMDCPATTGCKIYFQHKINRGYGNWGGSHYTIKRVSNLTNGAPGFNQLKNETLKNNEYYSALGAQTVRDSESGYLTLYPGMKVCESLTFQRLHDTAGTDVTLEVCVRAMGDAQPSDPDPDIEEEYDPSNPNKPSSDSSFINIKARNGSVSKFDKYQRFVYAKPGDMIGYRATYNPVLQYTYYLVPDALAIQCDSDNKTGIFKNSSSTTTLGPLFNSYRSNCGSNVSNWNNSFSVQLVRNQQFDNASAISWVPTKYPSSPTLGSTAKQQTANIYRGNQGGVMASDVGKTIDERAITNAASGTKTTLAQVSFACQLTEYEADEGSTGTVTNTDEYEVTNVSTHQEQATDEEGNLLFDEETGEPIMIDVEDVTTTTETTTYEEDISTEATDYSAKCELGNPMIATAANVQQGRIASALVPYNFNTSSSVKTKDVSVPAGEEFNITYEMKVLPKTNIITTNPDDENRDYATRVDEAINKLIVYYPDSSDTNPERTGTGSWGGGKGDNLCSYYGLPNNQTKCGYKTVLWEGDKESGTLNESGNMDGSTEEKTVKFYAQDMRAGSKVCVAVANYPSTSGSDTNWSDKEGNHKWRISDSKCYTIAKKPSVQVWGGNVYSRGQINTAVSKKVHLQGYVNYNIGTSDGSNYVFGSFGELGLISSARVTGFASGATTGYSKNFGNNDLWPHTRPANGAGNNGDTLFGQAVPGPGGKKQSAGSGICTRSPLTIPNTPCGGETINAIITAIGSTASNLENDKNNIIANFVRDGVASSGSNASLNDRSKAQSDGTYYHYNNGDINVGTPDAPIAIANSTIQMVHSRNTVYIKGDLVYSDEYEKYSELPKLIIYGKNVVIDCNVNRVDALVIADEKVVTCNNFDGNVTAADLTTKIKARLGEAKNSNQLTINGAVIAKTLIANRTYGAATGANSIIPSEIINFDPTLYMWGGLGNDEGSDGDLEVTMVKELAPRR